MSDWRSIASAARAAGALLLRDQHAGEVEFERLLRRYPLEGMVLLERGRARIAAGDVEHARPDLETAVRRLPLQRYKEEAKRELSRLPAAGQPDRRLPDSELTALAVPSPEDLQRAHALFKSREVRAEDFDVAARLLEQALDAPDRLSPTVPTAMLLQSWNFAYYQDGRTFDRAHFARLDVVLNRQRAELLLFRRRTLGDLQVGDEKAVKALFEALFAVVGRVGAPKIMHLWAPLFFPLWDTPIAKAYGFDLSEPAEHYRLYMRAVREQLERLVPPPGVSPLKALDEYNYCAFTKSWLSG